MATAMLTGVATASPDGLSLDVPAALIKDPRSWTVEDISAWLYWLGIGEHAEAFAARGVDGRALLQLGADSAWAELGVGDAAQRHVLDSAVEPLRVFQDTEGIRSGLALHAMEGPVAGDIFFLGAGVITGGRHSASNEVVLSENYVSRRHFQVTRDAGGQHLLQDVGSTTGTFLMIREELVLLDRMVLQLGTTELSVGLEGDTCTLTATEGPDKDARAAVPIGGLHVGREANNGLCIRDPQISAFHCEVRPSHEIGGGYVLDDKYSTNRTWLRLAPDGQPSNLYVLSVGDLFKVGSTLFHVVDPSTFLPAADAPHSPADDPLGSGNLELPDRHALTAVLPLGAGADPLSPGGDSVGSAGGNSSTGSAGELDASRYVGLGGNSGSAAVVGAVGLDYDEPSGEIGTEGSLLASSPGLQWEPMLEGETRPALPPEEYARLLLDARQQALESATGGSAANRSGMRGAASIGAFAIDRGNATAVGSVSDLHEDMHERELSSLQRGMQNSRAQTAYTLQQRRPEERPERRDENLCKICYEHEIDIVLYPCGHLVVCRWCAQHVSDCPVCRQIITDIIRTYKT